MTEDRQEYEVRKRAIFDSMSKRGQERVLRIGYENWDPFQEPKDPREKLLGATTLKANSILREFYKATSYREQVLDFHVELLELCQGLLRGEVRPQVILEFCNWYKEHGMSGS